MQGAPVFVIGDEMSVDDELAVFVESNVVGASTSINLSPGRQSARHHHRPKGKRNREHRQREGVDLLSRVERAHRCTAGVLLRQCSHKQPFLSSAAVHVLDMWSEHAQITDLVLLVLAAGDATVCGNVNPCAHPEIPNNPTTAHAS